MARLPRYFAKGIPQHVILRGNNRDVIFANDEDRQFFREVLLDAAKRYSLAVHAYVLMTNHIHLLASPETAESLPKTLQSVGRRYVQYFNYRYQRTGTLWEGRYRATVVETERYLFECMRSAVRECTNKGWALGGERFQEKIERLTQRRTRPQPKGRPKAKDS